MLARLQSTKAETHGLCGAATNEGQQLPGAQEAHGKRAIITGGDSGLGRDKGRDRQLVGKRWPTIGQQGDSGERC
jgi:hypothetical protein